MLSEVASGDAGSGEAGSGGDSPAGVGGLGDFYGLILVLFPIMASLIGMIRGKIRPREKWSTCLMAAHQVPACPLHMALNSNAWPYIHNMTLKAPTHNPIYRT